MRSPVVWAAAIAAVLVATPALTDDANPEGAVYLAQTDHSDHDHDHGDAGHSMDPEAAMAAWMEIATPGEPHEEMGWFVGDWKVISKMYMGGPEPMTSEGSVHYEWLLPGRHLMGTLSAPMMGQPMTGKSIDGYDNATGEYFTVWLDNMSTGPFVARGKEVAEGKIEYHAESFDPSFGQLIPHRCMVERTGDDAFTFTMYMTPPGGDETKIMESSYTRM
jgi:hypothetical protein